MYDKIFEQVMKEINRQNDKWGPQSHLMILKNNPEFYKTMADDYKKINDTDSNKDWFTILMEEVYEAFAENTREKQIEELTQVAAVTVQIIKDLSNP
jgi:PHD/YefM family antitoxin component YafN of YafNO toxin-antitoxin module